MRVTKLTLSADKDLIAEAKKLAAAEGTSLSSMFTRLIGAVLSERRKKEQPGPITRKATGLVKLPRGKSDRDLIADALAERYGM
ncbi:MAG TPA: DUF6364 family protein [Planctomycetota bacterium]|nr:DUF6364 family protein [Planctomycetota bacterium]